MRGGGLGLAVAILGCCCGRAGEAVVYLSDIESFSPQQAIATEPVYGKWYLRRVRWAEHAQAVLNLGGAAAVPDLTCAPALRGRYNAYVGCRQVDWPTVFQVRLGDDQLWYTIDPGLGTPQEHTNRDILFARDVDMTGKNVTLHAVSPSIYFYYFKLVRAEADATATVDPALVKREPVRTSTDEVEARLKSGYFVERIHVDDTPVPPLTAAQQQAGYVLFRHHYLDLVFPNTMPTADAVTDELEVFATAGEFEPVTFGLRAVRDLAGVSVTVGDLRGPQDSTIPAAAVDVRSVRCLRKRSTGFSGAGEFMVIPNLLESRSHVDVRANETKAFWLTVQVPDRAAPGRYQGTVTVTTADARQALALTVEVLPLRLPPEAAGYMLGMYDCWPQGVTPLAERCRDMRDHGLTTLAWGGEARLALELHDGKVAVGFDGSRLATVLETHARHFSKPLVWLMDSDLDTWCQDQAEHGADYGELYAQVIRSIAEYCQQRGFPGIIYQPQDECPSVVTNFPSAVRQLQALKAAGAVTEMDHMAFRYPKRPEVDPMVQQAMPLTDVLTLRYSTRPFWYEQTWAELVGLCAQNGKTLWTYNINDGLSLPEPMSNRFSTGFFFLTLGKSCTGELYWCYENPCAAMYEDLDGNYTDYLWRYPPWEPTGEVGGPTILWECVREGVDDLRYIERLRALIASRKPTAPEAAGKAQAVLDSVFGSFQFGEMEQAGCRYLESVWERRFNLPDGRRACSGSFRFPNGWQAEDYDRARRRIAEAIIELDRVPAPEQ